jgi:ABC-type bacteriocin/lantibiotic exporter with double-glycine peptidase domain
MDEAERQRIRDEIELKQFLWRHKYTFSLNANISIIIIFTCLTLSIISPMLALISIVVLAIYSTFILFLIIRSLYNGEKKRLADEIDCLFAKLLNSYDSEIKQVPQVN